MYYPVGVCLSVIALNPFLGFETKNLMKLGILQRVIQINKLNQYNTILVSGWRSF